MGFDFYWIWFLFKDGDEMIYWVNLSIVDVVLDIYFYNGVMMMLEMLWMEVLLVIWVGKQFVFCNSYIFLIQLNIREGFVWND